MEINTKYNSNFQSKNRTIRRADDLARQINRAFPRQSASLTLPHINPMELSPAPYRRLWGKIHEMRELSERRYLKGQTFISKVKALINPIKKYKVGNCGESTDLAYFAAIGNGIKNCYRAHLISPYYEDYDHAVLYVDDKKPYIIDAWLGFADYVPNAIKRYQKDYRYLFCFEAMGTEKIELVSSAGTIYTDKLKKQKITDEEIKILQETFPELILKNND